MVPKDTPTADEWTADKIWDALYWGQEGYPQWGQEGYRQWRKRFDKLAELINAQLVAVGGSGKIPVDQEFAEYQNQKQLVAEQDKADNLFKVARKHSVENQELKKQLAAEKGHTEAWNKSYHDEQKAHATTARQLAAAVEAIKLALPHLHWANTHGDRCDEAIAALARIKEGK